MSWAMLSSMRCEGSISMPTELLVYAMVWLGSVLGMRSSGGANSMLSITNPHVLQTISPFLLSTMMVLLLHSVHFLMSLTVGLLWAMLMLVVVWLFGSLVCLYGCLVCLVGVFSFLLSLAGVGGWCLVVVLVCLVLVCYFFAD